MDRLRDIVLFVSGAIAIVSLLLALYEGFNQRVGAATFLGALFVAATFIVFLPKLEVFKAFGIEATLRQTVTEAVATLDNLKRLSEISARATYMQMAWGNRWGGPPAHDKQAILDEVDAQLEELKVSAGQRAEISRPFVRVIGFDFFHLFKNTIMSYAGLRNQALVARASHEPTPANLQAAMDHSDKITAWTKLTQTGDVKIRVETYRLVDELNRFTPSPGEWLDEKELEIADKFKNEIIKLNEGCEKKGGYTTEAAADYDGYYENTEFKAQELFGQVLTAIK